MSFIDMANFLTNPIPSSIDLSFFFAINLGLLAISIIVFSLFELKSKIESKFNRIIDLVGEEKDDRKKDILELKLRNKTNEVLIYVDRIYIGFRKCIYFNIINLVLIGISYFKSLNILLGMIIFLSFYCLWVITAQVHNFKKIFGFNLKQLMKETQSRFDVLDKKEYSLILTPE